MLTSERIDWLSEEGVEVSVEVGMKLVPLFNRDTVSGDNDLVVKLWILLDDESLICSRLISCVR